MSKQELLDSVKISLLQAGGVDWYSESIEHYPEWEDHVNEFYELDYEKVFVAEVNMPMIEYRLTILGNNYALYFTAKYK